MQRLPEKLRQIYGTAPRLSPHFAPRIVRRSFAPAQALVPSSFRSLRTRSAAAAFVAAKASPSAPAPTAAAVSSSPAPNSRRLRKASASSRKVAAVHTMRSLVGPAQTEREIWRRWTGAKPPEVYIGNPKSTVAVLFGATPPKYAIVEGKFNGQHVYRAVVVLDESNQLIGIGDGESPTTAQKNAALALCLVCWPHFSRNTPPSTAARLLRQADPFSRLDLFEGTQATLDLLGPNGGASAAGTSGGVNASTSKGANGGNDPLRLRNGEVITIERAREFMDWYCKHYKLGKVDMIYESVKVTSSADRSAKGLLASQGELWTAALTVQDRRIGFGEAGTKAKAAIAAHVDCAQYLDSCDPNLWAMFSERVKSKGVATTISPVLFEVSAELDEDLRELVRQSHTSQLYQRAARIRAAQDREIAAFTPAQGPAVPVVPPRPPPSAERRSSSALDAKSQFLARRQQTYESDPRMAKMRDTRASLPVTAHRDEVLSTIEAHPTTVLMAATGSGKTTQVPQMILEEHIRRGTGALCNVVCTQPRRLAAVSVAERVAAERGEKVGESIGYQVRFEVRPPSFNGSVTYCTIGIFLRKLQATLDSQGDTGATDWIDAITHVVVDEVHERDVDTDLLLFVLKRIAAERRASGKPAMKIVLMSATIDATLFRSYFADPVTRALPPVLSIPGRAFPVQRFHLDDVIPTLRQRMPSHPAWSDRAVVPYLERELHRPLDKSDTSVLEMPIALMHLLIAHVAASASGANADGHVLCFLPGFEEIRGLERLLRGEALFGCDFNDERRFEINILHSTVPLAEQQRVFSPPASGVRRVILATNIAETSVTIPDVVFVVDGGMCKEKRYDPSLHLSALVTAYTGTSNMAQRAGRAGRHREGQAYSLVTKQRFHALPANQTVEMQRVDLSEVVMHIKALDLPVEVAAVLDACIEPPGRERVGAAIERLQRAGALDAVERLTSLGRILLMLGIEVAIGKMLLLGSLWRCLDKALSLAVVLTHRDPFMAPLAVRQQARQVKASWGDREARSDPLLVLAAFDAWRALQASGRLDHARRFAVDNFLSMPTLTTMDKVRSHLLSALDRTGVLLVSAGRGVPSTPSHHRSMHVSLAVPPALTANSDNVALQLALVAAAQTPNFAIRSSRMVYATDVDTNCVVHASSCNTMLDKTMSLQPNDGFIEREILAFGEKSVTVAAGKKATSQQVTLRDTSRLDPLVYVLFGAHQLDVSSDGLKCDGWLPVRGNVSLLECVIASIDRVDDRSDMARLKETLNDSLLRVFDGLGASLARRNQSATAARRIVTAIDDADDDGENAADGLGGSSLTETETLTTAELHELDALTAGVAHLLARYRESRMTRERHMRRFPQPSPPRTQSYGGTSRSTAAPSSFSFGGRSSQPSSRWPSRPPSPPSSSSYAITHW